MEAAKPHTILYRVLILSSLTLNKIYITKTQSLFPLILIKNYTKQGCCCYVFLKSPSTTDIEVAV
jgi:hypothetical protein